MSLIPSFPVVEIEKAPLVTLKPSEPRGLKASLAGITPISGNDSQ